MIKAFCASALLVAGLWLGPAMAQTKDTLSVDLPGDAATLDPQIQSDTDSYSVYRNIFDNLIARKSDGTIGPQVASAWRYLDDATIEFDIRGDIKFHDGSPLSAEDVVFTVRRVIDPKFASPQLTWYDSIASAEVTGPNKVTLKTKSPYAPLLAQLVNLSIVPKAYVEKVGNQGFNLEPVGSGPYRFKAWRKGAQISLEANDGYWRGSPPFRAVEFRVVPDVATRIANLQTSRSDITRRLLPEEASTVKKDQKLQVLAVATERISFLFMNAMHGPTADVRVRRAIAHAIDRPTLIEALTENYGKPVGIDLSPAVFGYTDEVKGYDYDPAKAKALIKEAKAEGAQLVFPMSPVYDRKLAEAIQQMLQDVGLKVEIVMLDHPTFLRRRQGRPDEAGNLALGRWSCACQDADGVIYPRYRTGTIWSKYSNPAFDTEVDAARVSIDPKKRLAHYKRAFEIMREDVPSVGLFQDFAIYGAAKQLRWTPTPDEAFFIFDMKWVP
jgi:peptide/nickel transport system substrate-binding protein